MSDIYSIINELYLTSSRKEKEAILTREKNNTLLTRVLSSAYNPHINYYIKQIPGIPYEAAIKISLNHALDKLDAIVNRSVTGNAAIARLAQILGELNERDRRVLEMVVLKDLRCGVSEATINKIWKGLIPTYPCLLASSDEPKARAKIKFPALAQEKCDGMRINAICLDGNVTYFSRNGKPVDCGSESLDKEVRVLSTQISGMLGLKTSDCVIDGELLVWDNKNNAPMPRKQGNGICNKAIQGTVSEKEKELFVLVVWDAIPYNEFVKGKGTENYEDRWERVEQAYDLVSVSMNQISLVPTWYIESWDEAKFIYNKAVSQGKEGLIIKNMKGVWEDKRSPDLVKMKEECECAVQVVDWVEGTGKYAGKLGALVCQSRGDNPICVSVGSGFSDEEREQFTRQKMIGRVISVIYNEIITKEDGTRSLFLPRFDQIRFDKNDADIL